MKILKPRLTRYSLYRQNTTHEFRDKSVRYSLNRSLVFLNGSVANPLYRYELVTAPLIDGSYKFKIVSEDDLKNVNSGVETTGVVTKKLWYPTSFRISAIVANLVTFSWAAPSGGRTPTYYVIYGNGGSGYEIDRGTPLATIATGTWTTNVSVTNGKWLFVIESKDGTGETVNSYCISQTVPVANAVPRNVNDPGDQPVYPVATEFQSTQLRNVQLRNVSVGKCEISFMLPYPENISYFRIYHDSGTGTIDWVTYAYRVARTDTVLQVFTTDQLFSADENRQYLFGIRAESADGIVEGNLIEYNVTIDGEEPVEVQSLTAGPV